MAEHDIHLEFKGPELKGESQDEQFKDMVQIQSYLISAINMSEHRIGAGGGTGKVQIQEIPISKYMDKASPTLFKKCCDGTHFSEVVIHQRKKAGDKPIVFAKTTLKKVTVTHYSAGGHDGTTLVNENITLAFEEVKIEYTEQKPDGTKGSTVQAGWNSAKNALAA